jgi:hypothetical protein
MEAILAQRLFADPPSVRPFRPDVPADLEYAVERGMRRERGQRFATLLDMAEFLGGAQATTPRPGAKRRFRRLLAPEELPTVQLSLRGRIRKVLRAGAATAAVVAIAAAGSLWAFGRPAPSDRLWPGAGPPLAEEMVTMGPEKPPPPAASLEKVRYYLEEGGVWFSIGRYEDALTQYWNGLAAVTETSRRFAAAGVLDSLRIALQRAIEEVELACAQQGIQGCADAGG